jgi:hypothetical protein
MNESLAPDALRQLSKTDEKTKYLSELLETQINGFKKRRESNRSYALRLKISITVLGSIITILLGLKINGITDLFASIALVLSGAITILNTLEGYFDYRTLWLRYTLTVTRLLAIKTDLDYLLLSDATTIADKEIDELYKRYSNILAETNEAWLGIRKDKSGDQTI